MGKVALHYDTFNLIFRTERMKENAFFLTCTSFPLFGGYKLSLQIGDVVLPISEGELPFPVREMLTLNWYVTENFPEVQVRHFLPHIYFLDKKPFIRNVLIIGNNAIIVLLVSDKGKILKLFSGKQNERINGQYAPEIKLVCNGVALSFPLTYQQVVKTFGSPKRKTWSHPSL